MLIPILMKHFEQFESYIPFDLLKPGNMSLAIVALTAIVIFRYFLITGLFYIPYYKFGNSSRSQIYKKLPDSRQQLFEIKWSLVSSIIFGVGGVLMGILWQLGLTKIYLNFSEHHWTYLLTSAFVISVIHDLYFYLTHRFLHIPWVFKRVHHIHHHSLEPSPWASFSFHPIEAVIQALFLPLVVLFVPVHPVVILSYLTIMTVSAVINHLGFEVMPQGNAKHWMGRNFISGVHHSEHHRFFNCNFGLFYTWFDHLFKTQNAQYVRHFQEVTGEKS